MRSSSCVPFNNVLRHYPRFFPKSAMDNRGELSETVGSAPIAITAFHLRSGESSGTERSLPIIMIVVKLEVRFVILCQLIGIPQIPLHSTHLSTGTYHAASRLLRTGGQRVDHLRSSKKGSGTKSS